MFDFNPGPITFDPNADYMVANPAGPPSTPTNYAPYLTALGGGYAAASTLMAAQESARQQRANAAIAGLQARSESRAGAEQAELYRQHLDATLGKQAASIGASNVTVSGSPLRALANTTQLGAEDISRIQANASRKAWGFEVQQQGDLVSAKQTAAAGVANTIGGLITSSARAYGQWAGLSGS